MVELANPKLEAKRLDKLQRARAQANWREEWLGYNQNADDAATRARRRHPVPAEEVARIGRIDDLAARALRAAAEAVELASPPRRSARGSSYQEHHGGFH